MMLKEVLQKKFEYGVSYFNEEFIYFKMDEHTICKAQIHNLKIEEKYKYDGIYIWDWIEDFLLIKEYKKGKVHVYSLPEFKELLCSNDEIKITRSYNNEKYFIVQSEDNIYVCNKKGQSFKKVKNPNGIVDFCLIKDDLFVCKDFQNLYIYEMKEDSMAEILHVAMDDIFPKAEIQRWLCSDYESSDMQLWSIKPYEEDLILITSYGIARITRNGTIVWRTFAYGFCMQFIGHYGYESFNSIFYRIDLDNGELCLYDNNGKLPPLSINGHEIFPSGDKLTIHDGLVWRMLYDGGLTLLAAIDPETGKFKYFHRFYDIAYENCRPKFINGKLYLYDAITKTLHVLEEVEGEPEKTFCGVPMSETELELVDTTKKVNNKKPAPTYEDADIPLFEEIKQVVHIEHACVLDAECIDSLGDYSDVVTSLLSLADVRKFTIIEHSLSGSISLKKGRKEVEFTPDGSDYIDSDAMLKALNEFLPICGAKGKIFSLWTPDMLQAEMFFYTEDTEAVEKYSAENLQTNEAVDFEDMKGEIKW